MSDVKTTFEGNILSLVKETEPILRQKLEPFDFANPPVDPIQLAKDMATSMLHYRGVGLAANQCGLPHRMFVMHSNPIRACFNPRIVDVSEETIELEEGCLSIPKVYLHVVRPRRIKVRYQQANGETITEVLHDISARVFQHELDHLEGKMFIDYSSKLKVAMARKKAVKMFKGK